MADQIVLSARHAAKTQVGASKDPIEIFHLHVGLEHDLFLASERAVCGFGKRVDPKVGLFDFTAVLEAVGDSAERLSVDPQA